MQEPKPITIRVQSRDGTETLQILPTASLGDVKGLLEKTIFVPSGNQHLFADQTKSKAYNNDRQSLSSLGIGHGARLFLDYQGERPQPKQKKKLKDIKKQWDLKSYMEHLDSQGLVFKNQDETHCKSVALDFSSCDKFQLYLHSFAFQKQRIGFLYGAFGEDGQVTVDFIHEPPQDGYSEGFEILESTEDSERVEHLACLLGYQKVGWVFSHPPERDYLFSSSEVLKATEFQVAAHKKFGQPGKAFVTLKVTVTDEGMTHFEAFQVTDQCMKLYNAELFRPSNDPKVCRFGEQVLMHREGAGRKDSNEVETIVLLKPVALKGEYRGRLTAEFPIENRPDQPQTKEALKAYLSKNKTKSFLATISDFHLLLFLGSTYLDPKTDMPALCEAVRTRKADTSALEGFKLLIESFAGLL